MQNSTAEFRQKAVKNGIRCSLNLLPSTDLLRGHTKDNIIYTAQTAHRQSALLSVGQPITQTQYSTY